MEATEAKRGQKRVSLPSVAEQDVIALTVQLLVAKSGTVFGRGFRLRAIGRKLYVQLSGLKAPLFLDFDSAPMDVQNRGLELRAFLLDRGWVFDAEAWRDACSVSRVKKGKPQEPRLTLEVVVSKWKRLKLAEGVTEKTFVENHMTYLRRLDPSRPLSEDSIFRAIELTRPRSESRRRTIAVLRRVCALCGVQWNTALFEPLAGSGRVPRVRPQPCFSDQEIEAFLAPDSPLSRPWRRVVTLLAVYGLRPWEAWIAEPCQKRPDCAWVGKGKTNRQGETRPRRVPPFHPEWHEKFGVTDLWLAPLPALSDLSRAGVRVNRRLRALKLVAEDGPTAYGFRHAYAQRLHSPRHRVTDAHASVFMGHTVASHHTAYRNWLSPEDPVDLYLERPS